MIVGVLVSEWVSVPLKDYPRGSVCVFVCLCVLLCICVFTSSGLLGRLLKAVMRSLTECTRAHVNSNGG